MWVLRAGGFFVWGFVFGFCLRPLFRFLDLAIIKRGEGRREQKRDKQLSFTKYGVFLKLRKIKEKSLLDDNFLCNYQD